MVSVSTTHQHESATGVGRSPPSWTCLQLPPLPTPLGCQRAPVWVPWVIQRVPTGCRLTDGGMCVSCSLIRPTLSSPHCVHKSVLMSVSTAPLHIASTVTSFRIPYIRTSTHYAFLSFWLHCIPVYFLCVCFSEILLTVEWVQPTCIYTC